MSVAVTTSSRPGSMTVGTCMGTHLSVGGSRPPWTNRRCCRSEYTPVDQPPTGPLSQDSRSPLELADGGYYRVADPASPQVVDVLIHFAIVNPTTVSTVGVQTGDTFAA